MGDIRQRGRFQGKLAAWRKEVVAVMPQPNPEYVPGQPPKKPKKKNSLK